MSDSKELFSHFASILPVSDIASSINFYHDKLGFKVTFTWNDPMDYVVLKRGENVSIHLTKRHPQTIPTPAHASLYIFVKDADAVFTEYKSKGVAFQNPISNRDYGMRDFDIKDPDGHILTFGKEVT